MSCIIIIRKGMGLSWLKNIDFAYPWLLPFYIIIGYLIYYYSKNNKNSSLRITTTFFLSKQKTWKTKWKHVPFVFRCVGLFFLITALARPQLKYTDELVEGEGIDIVLCLDVSGSMKEKDFEPNRLEASKDVALDFIHQRKGDRIGVVIFTNQSFTLCPLTTDLNTVTAQIQNIRRDYLEEDGTAIGSGLATSVDRLRLSSSKNRIIILLTDGVDNGGIIPPDIAKEMAKQYGIKVYTIGVGSNKEVEEQTNAGYEQKTQKRILSFNESLLKEIADETGGQYFYAADKKNLERVYSDISNLEKSKIQSMVYNQTIEKFLPFLLIGLTAIIIELVFRLTLLRKFP